MIGRLNSLSEDTKESWNKLAPVDCEFLCFSFDEVSVALTDDNGNKENELNKDTKETTNELETKA